MYRAKRDRRSEYRGPGGTRDADGQTGTGTHGGTTGELAEIKSCAVSRTETIANEVGWSSRQMTPR